MQNAPSRAFEPFVRRVTSIVLVRLKQLEQYYLVTSLATRNDTQLLKINPCGGALVFSNQSSIDVFADEGEAFDFLSNFDQYEIIERGCGLLGYVPIGNVGLVLLATRIRTAVTLPGGHFVKLVSESKWLQIPLKLDGEYGRRLQGEELNNLQLLLKYTLNNAHYYCETADITRPFPSKFPVSEPSWEFVWNRYLAASLRQVDLADHCPHVLQGVVEAKTLEDFSANKYTFCLFSRRSRLHPGMRYIARGLNILASPGNEIECEQAVWTVPLYDGIPLKWSTYVWRRGTVPIWWGVELRQGGVGEADVVIPAHRPYKGTARYFRRLQKRYMPDLAREVSIRKAKGEDAGDRGWVLWPEEATMEDPTRLVPIICINLLRCNMQKKNELCLSEHFAESIRNLRRKIPEAPVRVVNFDWHGNMKELKEKGTVEGLWAQLEQVMTSIDVSVGMMEPDTEENRNDACTTPWPGRRMRWLCQQKGAVRYNCADSLDRTNAASYFGAIQTLVEQCRRLGIMIEVSKGAGKHAMRKIRTSKMGGESRSSSGELATTMTPQAHRLAKGHVAGRYPGTVSADAAGPLPQGWEARVDEMTGKTFYLDHNTRKTTWTRPPPPASSPMTPLPSGDSTLRGTTTSSSTSLRASSSTGSLSSGPTHSDRDTDAKENGSSDEARWGLFGCSVDDVRNKILPDAVAEHAEVFLINGDMQSNLYTASRAMHSHVINLLQEGNGQGAVMRSGVGKLANLSVAVQRRWSNMLTDATRQQILEMFLGLKPELYFPTIRMMYLGDLPLEDESDGDDDSDDDGVSKSQLRLGIEMKSTPNKSSPSATPSAAMFDSPPSLSSSLEGAATAVLPAQTAAPHSHLAHMQTDTGDMFGDDSNNDDAQESNQEILDFAIGDQSPAADLLGLGTAVGNGSAKPQAADPQDLLSNDLLQLDVGSSDPPVSDSALPASQTQFDSLI